MNLIMIVKRVIEMQYELYVDSLLLVNFVMNLYPLMLVSRTSLSPAAPGRLLGAAAFGAVSYFLPFLLPGPIRLRLALGVSLGTGGMILIAFRTASVRAFGKALWKLFVYSFFMGGILLFLIRFLPGFKAGLVNCFGIMALGGAGFLFLSRFFTDKRKSHCLCKATLIRKGDEMTVAALMDSGNSLIEPISGKPVSIIEKNVFQSLWRDMPEGFRAIPYHSIGKKRGILQGYLLPELKIEIVGQVKLCRDVYVAVSEELCGEEALGGQVKMILNPALLAG